MPPHHADITVDQPIGYFALHRNHLCRRDRGGSLGGGRLTLPLASGELGDVVFDFDLARHAVVKFDCEGSVALDNR